MQFGNGPRLIVVADYVECLIVIFIVLDRIGFCILLLQSIALSSSLKESEKDPTVPGGIKDDLMNFL